MRELARVLAAFDDDALAALASKGLVRRARKDYESGLVGKPVLDAGGARVEVAGQAIVLPERGPAFATCTCPATACCHHVLAAVMRLRDELAAEATEAPASSEKTRAELLALSLSQLTRWAGKATVRDGLALLERSPGFSIEEGATVVMRSSSEGVECRYFGGGGLDGIVVSSKERLRERYAVAAVVAYQRHHGVRPEPPALPERPRAPSASGAPRTPGEVLESTRALLEDAIRLGLAHGTPSLAERLTTLSISAVGVHLPRLSLELKRLGREVSLLLERNAQASEERLFDAMARVYALVAAVRAEPTDVGLAGRHRSVYRDSLEALDLVGVGAHRWRTPSGYRGLTVVFWSPSQQSFFSWTDSRPEQRDASFDPKRRYREAAPWSLGSRVDQMLGARLRLTSPKANEEGRLSTSAATRAERLEDVRAGELAFGEREMTRFSALREYATSIFPLGLSVSRELDPVVVACPASFGEPAFDRTSQTFTLPLVDDAGDRLEVRVVYSEWNEPVIARLEGLARRSSRRQKLVGRVVYRRGQAVLSPLSLLDASLPGPAGVANLNLDPLPKSGVTDWFRRLLSDWKRAATGTSVGGEEAPGNDVVWPPATERSVAAVESELLHVAESGRRALTSSMAHRLAEAALDLDRRNLRLLSSAVTSLARGSSAPADVLRLRYLCTLHRQAAVKASLTRS